MNKLLRGLTAGLLAGLGGQPALAQASFTRADSTQLAAAGQGLGQRYEQAIGSESHLLSGSEYIERRKSYLEGSPYYPDDREQLSTLRYDGFDYTGVPLRYDCKAEQVIFYPRTRAVIVQLVSQKLTRFTAGSHQFVRLETDSAANPQVRSGFYELLADGPVRLLAHHAKRITERPTPTGLEGHYYAVDRYFVEQGSTYTEVARLRDVTTLLPAQRAALQAFARSRRLSFREVSREASLTLLLRYSNTLAGTH